MKNRFTLSLILSVSLLMIISSCGSEAGSEEVKAEFDCECKTLFNQGGIELYSFRGLNKRQRDQARADNNQAFIDAKGDSVFTGTCAVLSDDRAKDILALHSFDKGYRTKKSSYEMVNGKKEQTCEFTYNEKDDRSGWEKEFELIGEEKIQISEFKYNEDNEKTGWKITIDHNTDKNLNYVRIYTEYKNDKIVMQYKLDYLRENYEGDFDDIEYLGGTYVLTNKSGEVNTYSPEKNSMSSCFFGGILVSIDADKTAELKSFLECVTKMKLKQWWYKFDSK